MDQTVRFVASPQGRIAWATCGTGPVLVVATGWVTDLESMWEWPAYRSFVEGLAEHFTVVRYDRPGIGMSRSAKADFGFDAELAAMSAVVDALDTSPVAMFAASAAAPVAATLAARRPKAIEALVLFGAAAHGPDLAPPQARASLLDLLRSHWGLGSRLLTDLFMPGLGEDERVRYNNFQRAAASAEAAAGLLEAFHLTDARSALPAVKARTLVLHRRGDRGVRMELGADMAAAIPGAQFRALDGEVHPAWLGDTTAIIDAVTDFVLTSGQQETVLTPRETEIAALVAQGLTNQAIADELGISVRTVESHLDNVRTTLGVRSRAQVAAWVASRG